MATLFGLAIEELATPASGLNYARDYRAGQTDHATA